MTGETDSWRAQTKPCAHQDPGVRICDPTRDGARLACECPGACNVDMGWQWPSMGSGALNTTVLGDQACWHKSFWRWLPLLEGILSCPSTENWMKGLLSMAPHIRTRSRFHHHHSHPSGSFHKPIIFIHQRAGRMKTTVTENEPNWSHGSQPCLTQWNYEPCHVGPPKIDRSWWRVLRKCGPLEIGMANHFSILAFRLPWTVWKGKNIWHWKMNSPGRVGAQYATGDHWRNNARKNEETEPKQNNTQWWVWLVMEARSDTVKSDTA